MEIYFVSWASVYESEPQFSTTGGFGDIFKSKRTARKAVMDDIKTIAQESLDAYGTKEDRIDAFGVATAAALAKKMIVCDTGDFIESVSEGGVRTKYSILKYDTDYAK